MMDETAYQIFAPIRCRPPRPLPIRWVVGLDVTRDVPPPRPLPLHGRQRRHPRLRSSLRLKLKMASSRKIAKEAGGKFWVSVHAESKWR